MAKLFEWKMLLKIDPKNYLSFADFVFKNRIGDMTEFEQEFLSNLKNGSVIDNNHFAGKMSIIMNTIAWDNAFLVKQGLEDKFISELERITNGR